MKEISILRSFSGKMKNIYHKKSIVGHFRGKRRIFHLKKWKRNLCGKWKKFLLGHFLRREKKVALKNGKKCIDKRKKFFSRQVFGGKRRIFHRKMKRKTKTGQFTETKGNNWYWKVTKWFFSEKTWEIELKRYRRDFFPGYFSKENGENPYLDRIPQHVRAHVAVRQRRKVVLLEPMRMEENVRRRRVGAACARSRHLSAHQNLQRRSLMQQSAVRPHHLPAKRALPLRKKPPKINYPSPCSRHRTAAPPRRRRPATNRQRIRHR